MVDLLDEGQKRRLVKNLIADRRSEYEDELNRFVAQTSDDNIKRVRRNIEMMDEVYRWLSE